MDNIQGGKKAVAILIKAGIILIHLLLLASCGVNHHLRRANHHIKKAEEKGAVITRDTTWAPIKITAPKMEFKTKLSQIFVKDTVIIRNAKGQAAKVKTDPKKDTIYIECPPQDVEQKVPVIINTEIKSPKGFWYYAIRILIAFIIGVVVGFLIRAGPGRKLYISIKEKPPV